MEVTTQRLVDAANQATNIGEGIALNLGRLLNEIELEAPGIQGHAGDKFFGKSDDIGRELKAILDALNHMADQILGSSARYGDTDADASAEIDKVMGEDFTHIDHSVISALGG